MNYKMILKIFMRNEEAKRATILIGFQRKTIQCLKTKIHNLEKEFTNSLKFPREEPPIIGFMDFSTCKNVLL